jgi:channel protein (hemolysin III family)
MRTKLPENIEILGFSDPFSSVSHLLAAVIFFLVGIMLLVRHHKTVGQTTALAIFVSGVIILLSLSGVYHLLTPESTGRMVLKRLDHAAIFFLIAATFTPIHFIMFKGFKRWGFLFIIWAIAITGITLKSIYFDDFPESLGLAFYLGMGWLGVATGYLLTQKLELSFIKYLLFGAAAYTIGAVIDFLNQPIIIPRLLGPHELFHVMVLVGITMHWLFVFRVVVPTNTQNLHQ